MTAANIQIKKILVGRGNTAVASTYDGVRGELVLDTGLNTLRVYDGTTTGGTVLATSQQVATIANLVANSTIQVGDVPPLTSTTGTLWYDSEGGRTYIRYANAWVDASPSVTDISITDLTANVAQLQTDYTVLIQELGIGFDIVLGNIETLTSNSATLTTNFNAYKTYANANAATITTNLNSYKTYANARIASLDANVGRILLYETTTGSGANVTVDTTPPIVNRTGSLWWDSEEGRLYLRYNNSWVDASPAIPPTSGIGATYASGAFHQLTQAEAGELITIGGGNSLFRLPQITANSLGTEFEFYFSADAGQVYLQAYYTDNRATTDLFRGSIFVGVDNSTQGRLHTATAGVSDANYLFLGQHHAKAGSYIRFKAIAFGSVGTWLVQGQCVGDTVNTTPNGQSYMFQNYYD
jgi:hypothetical protein